MWCAAVCSLNVAPGGRTTAGHAKKRKPADSADVVPVDSFLAGDLAEFAVSGRHHSAVTGIDPHTIGMGWACQEFFSVTGQRSGSSSSI